MDKVTKCSHKIRQSYISRFLASLAVSTTIMKSLGYPLAALTLTESQCNKFMIPIEQAPLPKMGVVKNICKSYLYGPREVQGHEFQNFFTKLCIAPIQILLRHGVTDSQVVHILSCCAEGHQLEIVSFKPFF